MSIGEGVQKATIKVGNLALWTEHWEAEALDSTCVTQHNSLNLPVLGSRTCATKELDLMNSKTQFQHFKIL